VVAAFAAALGLSAPAEAGDQAQCIPTTVPPVGEADDVVFVRARKDLETRRFEDAAVGFRYLAIHRSDQDLGARAALPYLEAVNQIGTRLNRSSCWDDIARDVPRLRDLYCVGEKAKKSPDTCLMLDQVQADLDRLEAQKIVEQADKGGGEPESIPLYEKGGALYFDMFRKYCEEPIRQGQKPRAGSCDELAYNAARAFRAARNSTKAISVYRVLINLDATTPLGRDGRRSRLAARATRELGALYHSLALYSQAADWYERFTTIQPNEPDADRTLSDAIYLRFGLGDIDQATIDTRLFIKLFGATAPIMSAQVVLALASVHGEKEEWPAVQRVLEGSMGLIDRAGIPIDLQMRAHALLARAGVRPKEEYAKVRGFWTDPMAAQQSMRNAWKESEAMVDRRMAKALLVLGEAFFAAAEDKRVATVDRLAFPTYAGPNDTTALATHLKTTVKAWYDQKIAAIESAEREYMRILDLRPFPTPPWVIAAGSRIGLMWADLADEIARASTPPTWMSSSSMKDARAKRDHAFAFDKLREPIRVMRAKPALVKCVDLSVKYQWIDPKARACDAWLAKSFKAEHHLVDEIIPSTREASSSLEIANPFRYDGTPVRDRSVTIVDH
jgi:tetratricopeptide (TPR) repeat protein